MKKLVVLMLVVGMASLASAAFTVSDQSVLVGGTVAIGIENDIADADLSNFFVGLVGANASWDMTENIYSPPVPGSLATYQSNMYYGDALGTGELLWYSTLSGPVVDKYGVGTLADFGLSADAVGTVDINLYDGNLSLLDTATVTITDIPEPITMALLGLGGLFLRRKK